jgi:hypothetical protein
MFSDHNNLPAPIEEFSLSWLPIMPGMNTTRLCIIEVCRKVVSYLRTIELCRTEVNKKRVKPAEADERTGRRPL